MTTDWSAGYVADIGYTYGYYPELNPLCSRLPLLNSYLAVPEIHTACELGFGQGISVNVHAAGSTVQWYGTDFNPSHAALARDLATASGADVRLWDDAFADFVRRPDLPDFDFIALHGIWSWISDSNRAVIVDFLRRKLKVGGVLYISYNTLPGWASFAPMRHLMTEHAEIMGAQGQGTVKRVDEAIAFAEGLLKTSPIFAAANPHVSARLEKIKQQDRHYLAHEYFNRDWHPMHFSTMADWLAPAKLSFACSAHYPDHIDQINLTADQQSFLKAIGNPLFRQSTRDFMINQLFRRDYWVKGPRALSSVECGEKLREHKVMLAVPRVKVPSSVTGALGPAEMKVGIFNPILDILADHKPKALGQIARALAGRSAPEFAQIIEAIVLLGASGSVVAVQDDAVVEKARPRTDLLNGKIIDLARGSADVGFLASPVSGGGIGVHRFHQLFLSALKRGRKTPHELALDAWEVLSLRNERLLVDGVALSSGDDNIGELSRQAQDFISSALPCLRGLGVSP